MSTIDRESGHFVNFAYGSNMSSRRLLARTPSASALGIARLAGYRLAWHKVGQDGSAKCDIVRTGTDDDHVWGVLYRIAVVDRAALDHAEGLGRGYDYRQIEVVASSGLVTAGVYVATHIDPTLRPFDWYWRHVVDGAAEHGLPHPYQQALRQVIAVADPHPSRGRPISR